MTKKNETAKSPSDVAGAQNNMNELYTAHQVHTLVQILFQQLAGGWNAPIANAPIAGPTGNVGWSASGRVVQNGPGSVVGAPQPLIYWYQ